jgi:ribosome-binding ATPase YchF (GTP1/OBG family)
LLNGALVRLQEALSKEQLARTVELTQEEALEVKNLHLLTMTSVLYSLNTSSNATNLSETDPEKFKELTDFIEKQGNHYVVVDAVMEADLKDFDGDEKHEMRGELGGSVDGINALIQGAYKLLGLQSFFTTGEKETRAWTIKQGWTAPQAGSAIHNDFLTKFIRADIVNCADLLSCESWGQARTDAKMQTVGKDYVMLEGDVVEFKVSP